MRRRLLALAAAVAVLTLFCAPAWADDIPAQLERGVKLYKEGKYSQAIEEIEFALNQIRQKKADQLSTIFPKAPSGWKAKESKAASMGRSMMGGGINVSREYVKDGGKGTVKMEVFTDSPLIQSLGMMLSNPMFIQSSKQARLIRIKGNKGILKLSGKNRAEIQTLIDKRILFQVEVRRADDPGKIAMDFANLMDIDKLKSLSK